jgi:hypothetical protein
MFKPRHFFCDAVAGAAFFLWLSAVLVFALFYMYRDMARLPLPLALFTAAFILCRLIRYFFKRFVSKFEFSSKKSGAGSKYTNGTLLFYIVTITGMCIWCETNDYNQPLIGLVTAAALLFLLRMVHFQMTSIDHSLEIITRTSTQPVNHILPHTNRLILLFTVFALFLALMAFSIISVGGGVYEFFGNILRRIIAFLTSFSRDRPPIEYIEPEPIAESAPMAPLDFGEPYRPFVFLGRMVSFSAMGLVAASIIYMLSYLISRLFGIRIRWPKRKPQTAPEDITETLAPPASLFIERIKSRMGPSNRIRRQFYKKVRKHRNNKDLMLYESDTARELAEKIGLTENIDVLTTQYEPVRYKGEN